MNVAETALLGITHSNCRHEGETVSRCELCLLLFGKGDVKLLGIVCVFTEFILSLCFPVTSSGIVAKCFESTVGKFCRYGHAVLSICTESLDVAADMCRRESHSLCRLDIPLYHVVCVIFRLDFHECHINIASVFNAGHGTLAEIERGD